MLRCIVNMTDLPIQFKDHLANFGFCSKDLITITDGIPIAFFVTKANARESSRRLTKKQLDHLNEIIGEADDYLGAQLIASPNPRNNQSLKGKLSILLLFCAIRPRQSKRAT